MSRRSEFKKYPKKSKPIESRVIQFKLIFDGGVFDSRVQGGAKSKEGCCFDIMSLSMLKILRAKINKCIQAKTKRKPNARLKNTKGRR